MLLSHFLINLFRWYGRHLLFLSIYSFYDTKSLGYLVTAFTLPIICCPKQISKFARAATESKKLFWMTLYIEFMLLLLIYYIDDILPVLILTTFASICGQAYYLAARIMIKNCDQQSNVKNNIYSDLSTAELLASSFGAFLANIISQYSNLIFLPYGIIFVTMTIIMYGNGLFSKINLGSENKLISNCARQGLIKGTDFLGLLFVYGFFIVISGTLPKFTLVFISSFKPNLPMAYGLLTLCFGMGSLGISFVTRYMKNFTGNQFLILSLVNGSFCGTISLLISHFNGWNILAIYFFYGLFFTGMRRFFNLFIFTYFHQQNCNLMLSYSSATYNCAIMLVSLISPILFEYFSFFQTLKIFGYLSIFTSVSITLFIYFKRRPLYE